MNKLWAKPIEQVAFTALENKTRVIGLTGATHTDRVSELAVALAGTLASSGSRTVLIDLSQPVQDGSAPPQWVPGDGGIGQSIRPTASGFDLLLAAPTPETRLLFSNAELYRRAFGDELHNYSSIVLEMPPVVDGVMATINPVGPALACDQVIMMCTTSRSTRDELKAAVQPLRSAGVKLSGVVMDDEAMPSLADEIAREIRRLRVISPAFAEWLEQRVRSLSLLNSH